MTTRRDFLLRDAPAAGLGLTATLDSAFVLNYKGETMPRPFYEFVTVRLQSGPMVNRFLSWIEKRALPLLQKHRFGPMGFFTAEVGPASPSVFAIRAHASLAELERACNGVDADPDWAAALAELEAGEPAFYREDSMLLRATPFAPPLKPALPEDPRHKIFELRRRWRHA